MDDEEEERRRDDVLHPDVPLKLPLSETQLELLKDPWESLTLYGEFLVLRPWFVDAMKDIAKAMALHRVQEMAPAIAKEISPEINKLVNGSLDIILAGRWLGQAAGLKEPKDRFWTSMEIPTEHLEWGRTIHQVISGDPLLLEIWSVRMAQLIGLAKLDVELRLKVESQLAGAPYEEWAKAHRAKYETLVPLLELDARVMENLVRILQEQYWDQGKIVGGEEPIQKMIDELKKPHAAQFAKAEEWVQKRWGQEPTSAEGSEESEGSNSSTNEEEDMATMTTTAKKMELEKIQEEQEAKFKNVTVMYVDDPKAHHIALPEGMTLATARTWLKKLEDEENRLFNFMHKFRSWYPFDAMWAVYRALAEVYGFAHVGDFKGMFGQKIPPTSISIEVGYGQKQQIPWGPIEVHGLSAPLEPHIQFDKGLPCLQLTGEIKNSERPIADKIIAKAEEILKTSSIYRGKAVEIDFTVFNPRDINFDIERAPRFMDTNIKEDEIILPDDVRELVDTSLWTPVRHTQVCREQKVPLRRGILLAGKYGVGKTLAARVTAMLCEQNGWTFLYVKQLAQLEAALYFAKRYEPCVVFAEDINRVVSGDRDSEMDKIFNTIDGVDRKNDEVMVIFTTNDLDDIHAGMLRPGRIDTVITVTPPDAVAAAKLVKYYGRNLIDPNADLAHVGKLLEGQIPAIIREAVERSKLAAIKDTKPGEKMLVQAEHLATAAKQMLEHSKLLEEPAEPKPDIQILGESLGGVLVEGIRTILNDQGREEDHENLDNKQVLKGLVPKHLLNEAGRPGNGDAKHTD